MKPNILCVAAFAAALSIPAAHAHQLWIEQPAGQSTAVVRFGEFGDNLRETSPGLLDKFGQPMATLPSGKTEQTVAAQKSPLGYALPFGARSGESIVAEDAAYPLYTWKQGDKKTQNRFFPAARLITSFAPQSPKLTLDLVPTGADGALKLYFKGQTKPKTKVTLTTQSGWSKEAHTDEQGAVVFDMPWQGTYVAEASVNERQPGERAGATGAETFEGTSYVTTLTYTQTQGAAPVPAGPVAIPGQ